MNSTSLVPSVGTPVLPPIHAPPSLEQPASTPTVLPSAPTSKPSEPSQIRYEGSLSFLSQFPRPGGQQPPVSDEDFKPFNLHRDLAVSVSVHDENEKKGFLDESTESRGSDPELMDDIKQERMDPADSRMDSLERLQEICNKNMPMAIRPSSEQADDEGSNQEGLVYQCHLCAYTGTNRDEFNAHVNGHYEFRCQKCEYSTKEEEAYRAHLKDEHNLTPEDLEDEQGIRVPRINSQGKVKTFKCKQCEFVAVTKEDFWVHSKGHIKPEKLLTCPKCPFVTEYKHHLEYHLRNHFGSKPFKCPSCNYSCVNKSMLNSHMKSHTNVYQYRCSDCTYATKYCHSLKLHLRKYNHQPAMVLNPDGTPNPLPIIDVYGTRRGPKVSKKDELNSFNPMLPQYVMAQMQHLNALRPPLDGGPFGSPVSAPGSLPGSPYGSLLRPEEENSSSPTGKLKCSICQFETPTRAVYENHMALHATKEREASSPARSSQDVDIVTEEEGEDEDTGSKQQYMEYFRRFMPLLQGSAAAASRILEPPPQPPQPIDPNGLLSRLYLEKMLKSVQTKTNGSESPQHGVAALDLSQEKPAPPAGSSVEGDGGSSKSPSSVHSGERYPQSTGSNKKDRRKGKAYKIERVFSEEKKSPPPPETSENNGGTNGTHIDDKSESKVAGVNAHECRFCEISFANPVMHTIHMGYHGFQDPFKCNICGEETAEKISFFLHIARKAHE